MIRVGACFLLVLFVSISSAETKESKDSNTNKVQPERALKLPNLGNTGLLPKSVLNVPPIKRLPNLKNAPSKGVLQPPNIGNVDANRPVSTGGSGGEKNVRPLPNLRPNVVSPGTVPGSLGTRIPPVINRPGVSSPQFQNVGFVLPTNFNGYPRGSRNILIYAAGQSPQPIRVILELVGDPTKTANRGANQNTRSPVSVSLDRLVARQGLFAKDLKYIGDGSLVAFDVQAAQLARILDSGRNFIHQVYLDVVMRPHMDDTRSIVYNRGPEGLNQAAEGDGQIVVVIDSGVDDNNPLLRDKVIDEACFSTDSVLFTSLCGRHPRFDRGDYGSARACVGVSRDVDGCDHGTHVAGIAVGKASNCVAEAACDSRFNGVATESKLIAIKARSILGGEPIFVGSDVLAALYFVERKARYTFPGRIAAVNLSLGVDREKVPAWARNYICGSDTSTFAAPSGPMRRVAQRLKDLGIAVVASTGNGGFSDRRAVGWPACLNGFIAVGNTTKSDQIWRSSNSSPRVDLLAPGSEIESAGIGVGLTTKTGTSMAAPHVAGAYAVLKGRFPHATVDQITNALKATGRPVTDTRNGVTKPRINITRALLALGKIPLTGKIRQNAGSDFVLFDPLGRFKWTAKTDQSRDVVMSQLNWQMGDIPLLGDFDGDGDKDITLYRPSTGGWFARTLAGRNIVRGLIVTRPQMGDLPLVGDFNSDGRDEFAIFRPARSQCLGTTPCVRVGEWFGKSANGSIPFRPIRWGDVDDIPIVGDFSGDAGDEIAKWSPTTREFEVMYPQTRSRPTSFTIGNRSDVPLVADLDGGKDDLIFRNVKTGGLAAISLDTGQYLIGGNSRRVLRVAGGPNDQFLLADFNHDGNTDGVVWQSQEQQWGQTIYNIGINNPNPGGQQPADVDACNNKPYFGEFSIRSVLNGKLVRSGTPKGLMAVSDRVGQWERFDIFTVGRSRSGNRVVAISPKPNRNGDFWTWLHTYPRDNSAIMHHQEWCSDGHVRASSMQFELLPVGRGASGSVYAIKSIETGRFAIVRSDMALYANPNQLGGNAPQAMHFELIRR